MNKKQAFIAAKQAGAAYGVAVARGGLAVAERGKHAKDRAIQSKIDRLIFKLIPKQQEEKPSYEPGTLGLSAVSEDIKEQYSMIVSRKDRRVLARVHAINPDSMAVLADGRSVWTKPFQAIYGGR